MKEDILIYEYQTWYFIIQRSQQGKEPNPKWGKEQRASENSSLFCKLPLTCTIEDMGKSSIEALDCFDKILPMYDSWELKELNKQLCGWIGVKSINTLNRSCRLVQVVRTECNISVLPFDNYNENPWCCPMTSEFGFKNRIIELPKDSSFGDIGKAIFEAFKHATYHPNKNI